MSAELARAGERVCSPAPVSDKLMPAGEHRTHPCQLVTCSREPVSAELAHTGDRQDSPALVGAELVHTDTPAAEHIVHAGERRAHLVSDEAAPGCQPAAVGQRPSAILMLQSEWCMLV